MATMSLTTNARWRASEIAIDIVIDNFDYARYLRAAIDSALAQSHRLTRVIVVDDGSTDGSRDIIRSYGDRVQAVFKPNGGQASAMNAAMERVRGDVVLFLDADDALEPDAAARVAAAFAAEPGLARVHFRLRVMDAAGDDTGQLKPAARLRLARGDLTRATLLCPFDAAWLPTSGNAFSTAALRRMLPIPEDDYRLCADWYLVHVSSLLGPVAAIDAPLARYRTHGANGFTRDSGQLDVRHVCETVDYAARTRGHLFRIASTTGITHDERLTASMCDVANRAVLTRLGPASRHESRRSLLRLGGRACRARQDVRLPMKAMFLVWLAAMLTAPRPVAGWLGELFLLPERRQGINAALGALHRS